MYCKVITLRYDPLLGGFPDQPLQSVQANGRLLEVREHFFEHGGVPCLTLLLIFDETLSKSDLHLQKYIEDPGKALPEEIQPLYAALRRWRNDRSKQDGVPAYTIFRNTQLAAICVQQPHTLAALREIEGVGEATCRKYGPEVLSLIPGRNKETPGEEVKNQ